MKTLHSWLLIPLISLLFFTGCQTAPATSTGPSTWALIASGGLDFGLELAVPVELDRNGLLYSPLQAVASGISAAFGGADLTPDTVSQTIAVLGADAKLDTATQQLIAAAINKGVSMYSKSFGVAVANATDPNVKELLDGISSGITKGLADWKARHNIP